MECWVDIEADEDVTSALSSDIAEDIERYEAANFDVDVDMSEENAEANVEPVAAELPALANLYEMFGEAQRAVLNCNLPYASAHLHRALNVFRDAIRAQNRTSTRQPLVSEMLRPQPSPM